MCVLVWVKTDTPWPWTLHSEDLKSATCLYCKADQKYSLLLFSLTDHFPRTRCVCCCPDSSCCCPDILLGPIMQVLAPNVDYVTFGTKECLGSIDLFWEKNDWARADKEKRRQVVILVLLAIKMCCWFNAFWWTLDSSEWGLATVSRARCWFDYYCYYYYHHESTICGSKF